MFGTLRRLCLRVRSPSRRPQSSDLPVFPLGLTEAQVEKVASLRASPEGEALLAALDSLCQQQTETLAGALPHDKYLFQCGVAHAIRVCAALPDLFTRYLEEHRARTSQRKPDPDRSLTFLNTPFWDGYQRDTGAGYRSVEGPG